ncbi:MAG: 30S ribosomal protein S12 methylthiotransferase RimO [Kiritimatiellae bacterium]|nr:30S ribosomal protein S12 methylthiotransferase RimO [Kiritimatiellia bacterium]
MKRPSSSRKPASGPPQTRRPARPPVVALISLGCAKNTVDSERILAQLAQGGFWIAEDPADADLCLVNTCGFIESAREEVAATLRAIVEARARGRPRVVAAIGCLVERIAEVPEFERFLSPADARIGFGDYARIADCCRALLENAREDDAGRGMGARRSPLDPAFHRMPRVLTGATHSVALKISEGCSHACRFCSIPRIRGPQVSRPIGEIVAEAADLVRSGARELLLIGQDTASYGYDLYGRRCLDELMRAIGADLPGDIWLRLMYAHPKHLSPAILETMADDARWQPYLDLPLQHISTPMLRRMGRGMTGPETRKLLDTLEARTPRPIIRTAFITGHPGETEADFRELLEFVCEGRFRHVGVFAFSPEPGTAAARQSDSVPAAVAEERRAALMSAQREISRRQLAEQIGAVVELMVDGPPRADATPPPRVRRVGRTGAQAPDVDGVTWLRGPGTGRLEPGRIIRARIVDAMDYDWIAEVAAG